MISNICNKFKCDDLLQNIDIFQCIRRKSAEIIYEAEKAILIKDKPSGTYMLSSSSKELAEELIEKMPEGLELVVTHDTYSAKLIQKKYKFCCVKTCYNTVYVEDEIIETNPSIEIRTLTENYIDIIMKKYSMAENVGKEYIEDRIKSKVMLGAFIKNELCGFIGAHTEGSIGLLEVFEQFRNKGIGTTLQAVATNKALKENIYAYGQVEQHNKLSMALQKKLGYRLSEGKVYWLMY